MLSVTPLRLRLASQTFTNLQILQNSERLKTCFGRPGCSFGLPEIGTQTAVTTDVIMSLASLCQLAVQKLVTVIFFKSCNMNLK